MRSLIVTDEQIFWRIIISLIALLLFCLFQLQGLLIDNEPVVHALKNAGYSEIVIKDREVTFVSFRGGGSGDDARFQAEAINPIGEPVQVYVFVGWPFKGATIRSL